MTKRSYKNSDKKKKSNFLLLINHTRNYTRTFKTQRSMGYSIWVGG